MAIFEKIDLTNITEEKLIRIMNENRKKASLTRGEIQKLEAVSKDFYKNTNSVKKTKVDDFSKQPVQTSVDTDFEDEINYYLEEINNLPVCNLAKKIKDILPEKSDYNYQKVLLRIRAEIIKNIKETKEFIDLYQKSFTKEELQTLRDDIAYEKEKIRIIANVANEEEKTENKEEIQFQNNLIFVPTSGGNIRVLEEINRIPAEKYEVFIGLFNSIKNGTFKNMKRFQNKPVISGISEVRDSQMRVIYDRLDANNYAIIAAFIKKTQNGPGYQEYLTNRISNYKEQCHSLKNNLSNEEFIKLQKEYEEELYRKLGATSRKIKQKGVQ